MPITTFAPRWELQSETTHALVNSDGVVATVVAVDDGFLWRCLTSDSQGVVDRLDLAKARCETAFWKEAWERDHRYDTPGIETMSKDDRL